MKEFTISKNDAGQRMDKFITKAIPKLPSSLLYKYIRLKRIKLNGKRCEISSRLSVGDLVQCYVSDEFFEAEEKRQRRKEQEAEAIAAESVSEEKT